MIYFVQAGKYGPVKIGYSDEKVQKRIQSLQVGAWRRLRLLGIVKNGTKYGERQLHRHFAKYNIYGEWFRPTVKLTRLAGRYSDPNQFGDDSLFSLSPLSPYIQGNKEELVLRAMEATQGNKAAAAKLLGISRSTLYSYIKSIQ